MSSLKDWLTFFRIHTAALTQGAFLLGYLLAGGKIGEIGALAWILYGTLFHAVGFSMNNLMDYKADKEDPSKKGHPLISGAISYETGVDVTCVLLFLLLLTGIMLTKVSALAMWLLIFCVAMGVVYNLASKVYLWAPVPITLTFGPLPAVSYFATGGTNIIIISLVVAYFICQIWWQIAISGYLKELEVEEQPNLLRSWGARIFRGKLHMEGKALLLTKVSAAFKLLFFVLLLNRNIRLSSWIGGGFLVLAIAASINEVDTYWVWNRTEALKFMAVVEITTFFALVAVLAPQIGGLIISFVLMVYFMVWYMAFNKYYWGTLITPKV